MDYQILYWIQEHLRHPLLDHLLVWITRSGEIGLIWILLGLCLLAFPRYRRSGLRMLLSLLLGGLFCNLTLKPLVARVRPYVGHEAIYPHLVSYPSDFSFPSGHSTASWSAAWSLFYRRPHDFLLFTALLYAFLISISRLYVFVHFPSDVLVGFFLGVVDSILAEKLLRFLEGHFPRLRQWGEAELRTQEKSQ